MLIEKYTVDGKPHTYFPDWQALIFCDNSLASEIYL
jgi:hypothetical protein